MTNKTDKVLETWQADAEEASKNKYLNPVEHGDQIRILKLIRLVRAQREVLEKYAEHQDPDCLMVCWRPKGPNNSPKCICGLEEALAISVEDLE